VDSLKDIVAALASMPEKERDAICRKASEFTKDKIFIPSPGPQTAAYFSKADVLLYGGAAGGGKTALLIGLALTSHHRSLIVRKTFAELDGLLDTTQKILKSKVGLVRGNRPKYNKPDGGVIHYAGLAADGSIGTHQGVDHDFIGVDEAANIPEDQIRLLFGWLRSDIEGQHCRAVLASNPPMDTTGDWMIRYFAPWLDRKYPYPAQPGELRYFITNENDEDIEVDGPERITLEDGRTVKPQSRTFIPAKVGDNPYYANTDYEEKTLGSLRGARRAALKDGNFLYERPDAEWQVIPTQWVIEAIERGKSGKRPEGVPMCAMGVDAVRGGKDKMTIAPRYDGWFDPIVSIPGEEIPDGDTAAAEVVKRRRDGALVIVDVVGIGASPVDTLRRNGIETVAYNGGAASNARTTDRTLKFYNKRAQDYWRFREALDPSQDGGSQICLPDDPELLSDLTTPRIKNPDQMMTQGILLESKEEIKKRIRRSPDKGDAVVMAHSDGLTVANIQGGWRPRQGHSKGHMPKVIRGYENRKK